MSQSERAGWPANLLESEDTDTPRGKDAWTGVRHPGLAVALSAGFRIQGVCGHTSLGELSSGESWSGLAPKYVQFQQNLSGCPSMV